MPQGRPFGLNPLGRGASAAFKGKRWPRMKLSDDLLQRRITSAALFRRHLRREHFRFQRLTASTSKVLDWMADHQTDGVSVVTSAHLARMCCITDRSARRALASARERGLIFTEHTRGPRGRQGISRHHLLIPKHHASAPIVRPVVPYPRVPSGARYAQFQPDRHPRRNVRFQPDSLSAPVLSSIKNKNSKVLDRSHQGEKNENEARQAPATWEATTAWLAQIRQVTRQKPQHGLPSRS